MSEQETELFEVECPSGLKGLVKALTVGAVSALSKRQNRRKGDPLGQLLRDVWQKTLEAGIYAADGDTVKVGEGIQQWDKMLLGDRAYLVFETRRLTYGEEFHFSINCRRCRTRIDWKLNLDELEVTGLSTEAVEAVEADGFNAVLHRELPRSGAKVGMKLLTGIDQRNVEAAQSQGDGEADIAGLLSRLNYIESATSPGERRKFVTGLHMLDLEYLREEWEKADIYVQDSLEIECSVCGTVSDIVIPTDEHFFSARSMKPRRRRSSTS
jgi:hypothetical protein